MSVVVAQSVGDWPGLWRVVGASVSEPCFVMAVCVINVMPVLFLHFIRLQYIAALPARKSAADITLSDATSQTEHQ